MSCKLCDEIAYIYTTGVSFSIGEAAPHHVLQDCISGECAVPGLNANFCFLWFTNCVVLFDVSLILGCLWPLVFLLNTLILGIWCFTILDLPGCFCPWTLIWEYRIQHGADGPLYVTSSYSTWIFCRGVSGFAIDCGVWCRGLTTCFLHVGPPFGNGNFKQQLGCRFDIMDNIFMCVCVLTYTIIYVLIHQIIFRFYHLKYYLFLQELLY